MTRLEVLELTKNPPRFVTHLDKGRRFVVKEILLAKFEDATGWHESVLYEDVDTRERYVRSVKSFCANFQILKD